MKANSPNELACNRKQTSFTTQNDKYTRNESQAIAMLSSLKMSRKISKEEKEIMSSLKQAKPRSKLKVVTENGKNDVSLRKKPSRF
jgi:hypothetical protein